MDMMSNSLVQDRDKGGDAVNAVMNFGSQKM